MLRFSSVSLILCAALISHGVSAADVESKRREARTELKRNEVEARTLVSEQNNLKAQLEKNTQDIFAAEKAIALSREKLTKIKQDTAALQALREEKLAKIAELKKAQDAVDREIKEANDKHSESHSEVAKLENAREEELQKKIRLEAQIAQLKERFNSSHDGTESIDAEIRKLRQKTQKLEEEARTGESELQQSDARLNDAKERLADVRARAEAKEAEVNSRKAAAGEKLYSANREREEARLKIDQAKSEQVLGRARARSSNDTTPLDVKMTPKPSTREPAENSMTVKRDCRVHASPNLDSKVLGVKHGGTVLSNCQKKREGWVAFPFSAGQQGYLAKTCF